MALLRAPFNGDPGRTSSETGNNTVPWRADFERPFDHVGSHVESARLRNDLLEPARLRAVLRITQDLLHHSQDIPYCEIIEFQELTDAVVCNACGYTWLIVSDGDRHHRDSLRERLQGGIQAGMRDAQRSSLQQLDLWSLPNDDRIRWNRADVIGLDVLAHRKHELN